MRRLSKVVALSLQVAAADIVRLAASRPESALAAGPQLTVASFNMARETDLATVSSELAVFVARHGISVVLLQEVQQDPGAAQSVANELATALRYESLYQTTDQWSDGGSQGLAILSRYPLLDAAVIPLKRFDLKFKQRNRIALAATVHSSVGTVRLVNVHLDSRLNTDERLEQLDGALDATAGVAVPIVIGGDFNTGNFSWPTRWMPIPFARQTDAVLEVMTRRGFETPFASTGPTFKNLNLKLDWIFSKGLTPVASGIDTLRVSDHRAIWTAMSTTAPADRTIE